MNKKKDEITEYALRLIKNKNFSSFSYDDIAKQMGITKAAVHYHFEKKEDLGIAVCQRLQAGLLKSFELCQVEMQLNKAHPWYFIESRVRTISPDEICPILSLQSDYENLTENLRGKIQELSSNEIKLMTQLIHEYNAELDADEAVTVALMGIKGALQYRRILGEEFFINTMESLRNQFYASIVEKE